MKTFKQLKIATFLFILGSFSVVLASQSDVTAYFNNNEATFYKDPYRNITKRGDNFEEIIINTINEAKEYVFVAAQEIRLPGVAKALIEKKQAGLDVRVILEDRYNHTILSTPRVVGGDDDTVSEHEATRFDDLFALIDMNGNGKIEKEELLARDAIYMLRHHKIKIKDDTADSSKGSGLMHHKFVVVDGKKLIVTSANFTMSDVHGDVLQRETTGNANAMIVFESEAMTAKFQEEFIIMWGRRGKKAAFGLNKPYRGVQKTQVNAETKISVQFSPTSRKMNWSDSTNGLIGKTLATAEHETLVALFAFSEQRLSRILESVYLRNEKFNLGVLVEPKFAYRRFSEVLDIWGIALRDANCDYEADNNPWKVPFMGAGIPILERGDMLHHKFAVVDGSKVIFGSQNWSGAANNSNDENILIVENSYIASQFRTEFYRLERYSRKGPTRNLLQEIDRIETKCSGTIDTF